MISRFTIKLYWLGHCDTGNKQSQVNFWNRVDNPEVNWHIRSFDFLPKQQEQSNPLKEKEIFSTVDTGITGPQTLTQTTYTKNVIQNTS